jgi:hypothetical protein
VYIDDEEYNFSGKLWLEYDSSDAFVGFRLDVLNTDLCDARIPNLTSCRFISLPDKSYLFAPEHNLCESDDTIFEIPRDKFTDMKYTGIRELDG